MKSIVPRKNTFYVKKAPIDDVGIIPTFADAYVGLTTEYEIKSNPDTSFYLVESNTASPDDFIYGEGKIKEMYLHLYVKSLNQMNPQTANWLDVFSIKPNIDITEGNMTIASGNYGGTTLLYNSYNQSGPWMIEDFDGTNKSFMDVPVQTKKIMGVIPSGLEISLGNLLDIAYSTNRGAPEKEYSWHNPWKNLKEEVGAVVNWGSYYLGAAETQFIGWMSELLGRDDSRLLDMLQLVREPDGLYKADVAGSIKSAADYGKSTFGRSDAYALKLEPIRESAAWWKARGAVDQAGTLIGRGAGGLANGQSYDVLDETYVARCTQDNSIFSDTYVAPDIREIKDQTQEGPGDTQSFVAYSYLNLVNSESPTDGLSLRMKCFWENYSGAAGSVFAEGIDAWNTANPFGRSLNGSPGAIVGIGVQAIPQVVHASIYGIPQPTPIDITTSGTGFPTYAPEIEITFKINRMDVSTYIGSGTGNNPPTSEGEHLSLDRSFNIIFNDDAPMSADSGDAINNLTKASRYWRTRTASGNYFSQARQMAPWISIVNKSNDGNNCTVYTNAAIYRPSETVPDIGSTANPKFNAGNLFYGRTDEYDGILSRAAAYTTTIPMGEWVVMRIKLNTFNASSNTGIGFCSDPAYTTKATCEAATEDWTSTYPNISGGSSLVYFPTLSDENGQMKYAVLAHGQPWGENPWAPTASGGTITGVGVMSGNAAHYPNMTLWVQNMRSINHVPDEVSGNFYDASDINNGYTKIDSPANEDKAVDILIDSISFNNWGPITTNTTICTENGMGMMTKIPAGNFMTPVKYPGGPAPTAPYEGAISVHPTGSGSETVDNYYGKTSAPTASYMSFGFASSGTIADETPHPFLMNNFSVGKEETAQGITMVSGGYFTSGNYLGTFGQNYQNNWFTNLTAGDDTKNFHITGGTNSVDNFVQKGTMAISGNFSGATGEWVKTGNPLVGAKIIAIGDDKTSIVVDKPEVFDIPLNTPLCIELNNTSYEYKSVGSGSIGYYDSANPANTDPLIQTKKRNGSTIYLSRRVYEDDARSEAFGTWNFDFNPVRNTDNVGMGQFSQWWWGNYNATKAIISPYQYWINLAMINIESDDGWGSWFGDTVASGNKSLQTRTYDGIVAVSGGSTVGTTFNEFLFNDGIYSNKWNIDFVGGAQSIVNVNTDFGYGALENTTDTVPDSDGGAGRMGRDFMFEGNNYINIGSYAYTVNPDFNQPFNFLVKPTYMNLFNSLYGCTVYTVDETTAYYRPYVLYGIEDPLPTIEDFIVSPSVDILKLEDPVMVGQVTKSNATDLLFTWSEEGEDINYRMLWVDTELISNKYHGASFIAPFNEQGPATTDAYYYTSASGYQEDTGSVLMTGSKLPDIEGVQGWGGKFGVLTTDTISSSAGVDIGNGSNMTHCFHLKPTASGTFFWASGATDDVWQYMISSSKVRCNIDDDAVTLTSNTSYDLNGKQPLAVILTYDAGLDNNNWKLYVNGKLEDTADDTTAHTPWPMTVGFGAFIDNSHPYYGFIEEVSLHGKTAYVCENPNKFVLPTKQLPDMRSAGNSNKYQSRMFLFDYHNVRGTSPTSVCRSSIASWKITGMS